MSSRTYTVTGTRRRPSVSDHLPVDDLFNQIHNGSNLTHQNVNWLMRHAFIKTGVVSEEVYDQFNEFTFGVCVIGDGGTSLRNQILNFISQTNLDGGLDRASIAICRADVDSRGKIQGDTHWTALHLRKVENIIIPYYFDSFGSTVPHDVRDAFSGVASLKKSDLVGDDTENVAFTRAIESLSKIKFGEVVAVACPQQKDRHSCGYHGVFNGVGAFSADNPAMAAAAITQDDREVKRDVFIESSRIELQMEFNRDVAARVMPSPAVVVPAAAASSAERVIESGIAPIAANKGDYTCDESESFKKLSDEELYLEIPKTMVSTTTFEPVAPQRGYYKIHESRRGNKFRVASKIYENSKDIKNALTAAVICAARDAGLTNYSGGIDFAEVFSIIEMAKNSGGVSNQKITDAAPSRKQKNFSALFQHNCEAMGIMTGRDDDTRKRMVGLRLTFLPDEILPILESIFSTNQPNCIKRSQEIFTEKSKNLKLLGQTARR